jgi:hypothetical protein
MITSSLHCSDHPEMSLEHALTPGGRWTKDTRRVVDALGTRNSSYSLIMLKCYSRFDLFLERFDLWKVVKCNEVRKLSKL